MLYPLSEEGVAGLKKLAAQLDDTLTAISDATNALCGEIPSEGLGVWNERVNQVIDEMKEIQIQAKSAAHALAERLIKKAKMFEKLLETGLDTDNLSIRGMAAMGLATLQLVSIGSAKDDGTLFEKWIESTQNVIEQRIEDEGKKEEYEETANVRERPGEKTVGDPPAKWEWDSLVKMVDERGGA